VGLLVMLSPKYIAKQTFIGCMLMGFYVLVILMLFFSISLLLPFLIIFSTSAVVTLRGYRRDLHSHT